jgi:myo-inositol 2-dehydrogenase/D-chiro-inositol 1-dehydrogenase
MNIQVALMGADHTRVIADDVPGAVLQVVCDASAERARTEAMSTLKTTIEQVSFALA